MDPGVDSAGRDNGSRYLRFARDGNADGQVYVAGAEGIFYRSAGGAAFKAVRGFGKHDELIAVHAGLRSDVWVLVRSSGEHGPRVRLEFSRDGGARFEPVTPPSADAVFGAIGGSSDGELVAAVFGRVYEWSPRSSAWTELTNSTFLASSRITALTVQSRRRILAMGASGELIEISPAPGSRDPNLDGTPR